MQKITKTKFKNVKIALALLHFSTFAIKAANNKEIATCQTNGMSIDTSFIDAITEGWESKNRERLKTRFLLDVRLRKIFKKESTRIQKALEALKAEYESEYKFEKFRKEYKKKRGKNIIFLPYFILPKS